MAKRKRLGTKRPAKTVKAISPSDEVCYERIRALRIRLTAEMELPCTCGKIASGLAAHEIRKCDLIREFPELRIDGEWQEQELIDERVDDDSRHVDQCIFCEYCASEAEEVDYEVTATNSEVVEDRVIDGRVIR